MANRFFSPDQQFADATGLPYSGGSLSFFAAGTSTPLNTYSDSTLLIANANPVVLDSAGRAGSIFLQNLAYKVVLKDVNGVQIWTEDPVSTSDFTAVAQFQTGFGSPNGTVAGTQGSVGVPASVYWDATNNILYVCTVTGTTLTATWTAINASTAAAVIPPPQGYLTLTSAVAIIPTDVTAATTVFYTPYVGNLVPIYGGASFTPLVFAELSLTLTASQAINTIYDVFVFSNSGVVTLAVGPAWSVSTAGSGARGSGASTTQLARVNGIWVNSVQITGRNGGTTYTINANQATYLGSISIDGTAGQVSCYRTWGQSRKWGVWNAYNRAPIIMSAGDATATWTYATATIRASNGSSANSISLFTGLSEEVAMVDFIQAVNEDTVTNRASRVGVGFNSTTAFSGTVQTKQNLAGNGALSFPARYVAVPSFGINTVTSLEIADASTVTYNGSESLMRLTTQYRG